MAQLDLAQSGFEVGLAGEALGKVSADNEKVDGVDERIDAWVGFIKVGNDGDAGGAGPTSGECGCRGVVTIYVENTGVGDPVALEFFGLEDEALISAAEDSALTDRVYKDEGLRAGSSGDVDELSFNTETEELAGVERGCVVVAKLANIAGAEAPGLAGGYGCCDLTAGGNDFNLVFRFRAADREG